MCSYFRARNEIILLFISIDPEVLTFVCEDGKKTPFFSLLQHSFILQLSLLSSLAKSNFCHTLIIVWCFPQGEKHVLLFLSGFQKFLLIDVHIDTDDMRDP